MPTDHALPAYQFLLDDTGAVAVGFGNDEFEAARYVFDNMSLGAHRGPMTLSGAEHDYEITVDVHFNQTAKPH